MSTTATCSPRWPACRRHPKRSGGTPSGCLRRSPRKRSTGSARRTARSRSRSSSTPARSRPCRPASRAPTGSCSAPSRGKAGGRPPSIRATSAPRPPPTYAGAFGRLSELPAPSFNAEVMYAFDKHDLVVAAYDDILDYQWDRRPITMAPSEPRVVDRPAIRHAFPADPMVAVQGAGRSLRHANDGRASADGKLTCRWPTQVMDEEQGVLTGAALIPHPRQRRGPAGGALARPRGRAARPVPHRLAGRGGRAEARAGHRDRRPDRAAAAARRGGHPVRRGCHLRRRDDSVHEPGPDPADAAAQPPASGPTADDPTADHRGAAVRPDPLVLPVQRRRPRPGRGHLLVAAVGARCGWSGRSRWMRRPRRASTAGSSGRWTSKEAPARTWRPRCIPSTAARCSQPAPRPR